MSGMQGPRCCVFVGGGGMPAHWKGAGKGRERGMQEDPGTGRTCNQLWGMQITASYWSKRLT